MKNNQNNKKLMKLKHIMIKLHRVTRNVLKFHMTINKIIAILINQISITKVAKF